MSQLVCNSKMNLSFCVIYLYLPSQIALQQHMQMVQEENILLKRTVEQTPSDLNKLHRQISMFVTVISHFCL